MATLKNMAKSAPLRDVYSYFDLFGQMNEQLDPGTAHGGEAGMGGPAVGLEWADAGNQAEGQTPAQVQFNAPEPLREAVTYGQQYGGDGTRGMFSVDPNKLPETRFGNVLNSYQVNESTDLFNPNLVYDDPNYGRITLPQNIDTRSWSDYFGPAIMSAAMAGMGALGAPSLATGIVNAGRAVGEGGLRGGADNILGLVANQFGVPSWVTALGQYGVNELLDGKSEGDMKMKQGPQQKDNWDLMGDPSAWGFDDLFNDIDNWDLMGEQPSFPIPGGEGGGGGDGITIGGPPSDGFNIPGMGSIGSILRALGIGGSSGGGSGAGSLAALLPLLAGIGGGINQNNRTEQATEAMLRANEDAMGVINERIGGMAAPFKPYTDAGASAVGQMAQMGPSNLASRYKPLGGGRGMNLGAMARGGR